MMYEIILNGFNTNGLVNWITGNRLPGVSYGLRTPNNTHSIEASKYTVRAKGEKQACIEPYLKVNNEPAAGLVVTFLLNNWRTK